jgi:hypothetical protein
MGIEFQLLILHPAIGALISLTPPEKGGNTWQAKQIEAQRAPIPFPGEPTGRVDINWSFGPVKVNSVHL